MLLQDNQKININQIMSQRASGLWTLFTVEVNRNSTVNNCRGDFLSPRIMQPRPLGQYLHNNLSAVILQYQNYSSIVSCF